MEEKLSGRSDPIYCDRIIVRWETYAKDEAEQVASGIPSPATQAMEAAE